MDKTVLITGAETQLGKRLVSRYSSLGYSVIAPLPQSSDGQEEDRPHKEGLLEPVWNKASFFSAKTVVREGLRLFRTIDEAVILGPETSGTSDNLNSCSIPEIDETLESHINGIVYIIKELLDYFVKNEKGLLSFAMESFPEAPSSPFQAGIDGFFHKFVHSVLKQEYAGLYRAAYITSENNRDLFSEFIVKYNSERLEKANGEWLKFSERKSLFSSLPILKKEI